MEKINVTRCHLPDRARFDAYIDSIYESARVTNNGPLVHELEKRLEEYLGVKNIVLVANGTLALQVAYKLLGLSGEVITTPFTFIATASSIKWEGLDVVFADIDPDTFNLSPGNIDKAITPNTSAIVPVHVFGNPCEVEEIQAIAEKHNLKVVYDAAHAFGVKYRGESVLSWGDISTLSLHATKLFHTIEGGALIIRDDKLYQRARRMINFGIAGQESIECLGINAKMNEFQAAMGLSILDRHDENVMRRRHISQIYDKQIGELVGNQQWRNDAVKNYGYYPVLFENENTLLNVKRALENINVFARRYFYPSLDEVKAIEGSNGEMSVSREIAARILCLPLYPSLDQGVAHDIASMIVKTASV